MRAHLDAEGAAPRHGRDADRDRAGVHAAGNAGAVDIHKDRLVLTREEEIRKEQTPKRKRRWAKSYRSIERRLLDIVDWQIFEEPADLLSLLPPDLPEAFTNRELADAWEQPIWLAQRATYCLAAMGALVKTIKRGNAFVFERRAG